MRIRDLKILVTYTRIQEGKSDRLQHRSGRSVGPIQFLPTPTTLSLQGTAGSGQRSPLGIDHVPTVCIGDLTKAQKRGYVLADNKLVENAGWDRKQLALELQSLFDMDPEFDVTVTVSARVPQYRGLSLKARIYWGFLRSRKPAENISRVRLAANAVTLEPVSASKFP